MSFDAHMNLAYSTIAIAPSPALSGTTATLQTGDGAKFPAVPFNVLIWPAGAFPLTTNAEIARVTAMTGDAITAMTRATATEPNVVGPRAAVVGDQIAVPMSGKLLKDIEALTIPASPSDTTKFLRGDATPTWAAPPSGIPNPIVQDLLFTDATYDVGKSGATRPRDGFFSRNVTVSGTTDSSSSSTGALIVSGGVGIAKSLRLGGILAINGAAAASSIEATINFNNASTQGLYLIDAAASGSGFATVFQQNGVTVGSITLASSATAYNTTSDKRLKRDRGVCRDTSILRRTVIHDFTWRDSDTPGRGVFAQEAIRVQPSAVTKGRNARKQGRLVEPWSVDYSKYVADLIVGWQQHEATIKLLTKQVSTLQRALKKKKKA